MKSQRRKILINDSTSDAHWEELIQAIASSDVVGRGVSAEEFREFQKYKQRADREAIARQNNPSVQRAWEEYQTLVDLAIDYEDSKKK